MKLRVFAALSLFLFLGSLLGDPWGFSGAYAATPQGPATGLISASPSFPGRTIPSSEAAQRRAANRPGVAFAERCTIPNGAAVCTALVTWSTTNVSSAVVTVQDTLGGGQVPFASGVSGSLAAQILPPPHRYVFRLYDSSSGSLALLADTTVLASGGGTITASPNPCTILSPSTPCTSFITWTTSSVNAAKVTVEDTQGGGENHFATGPSGSSVPAEIQAPPHQYTFRLYDISSGDQVLLAATTVLATGTADITASPNPCQIPSTSTSCVSTISWTTQNVISAVVTVQDADGGGEVAFASGTSGSQAAPIQAPPHRYTFRLYDTSSGNRFWLASTVVLAMGTGTMSASPNPCTILSGNTCRTTISWTTQNVTTAVVTVQDTGGGEVDFDSTPSTSKDVWIEAPPQQYTFRLYDASSGGRLLLTATVVLATGTGAITANPDPCQIPSGTSTSCVSTISWSTQNVTKAQVTKQDFGLNGSDEVEFASGNVSSGIVYTKDSPIEAPPGHRYYFRLYDTSSVIQKFWLQATEVLAIGTGMISADTNPCQIVSGDSCTTNISWSTEHVNAAEITVEDAFGGGEQPFTSGLSGTLPSGPILAPLHEYTFRLYDISSGTRFLVSLYTVVAIGTGTISASPNPCTILSGQTACTSTISWATANVTDAFVTKQDAAGGVEGFFASGTSGSQADTQIDAGHQYYFRLYDDSSGTAFWLASRSVSTTLPSAPAAPGNLTASAVSSSQINLAWTDNSSNEDGFAIERSPDGTGFSQIATVGANATTYSNSGLTPSTTYYYRVLAFNGGGNSGYSNTASATTLSPPAAPSNLTAQGGSSGSRKNLQVFVNLNWNDNSNNENSFIIERCQGSSCSNFSQIATVTASITTYRDSTVSRKKTYRYRVKARNAGGDSAYSNIAPAKTP